MKSSPDVLLDLNKAIDNEIMYPDEITSSENDGVVSTTAPREEYVKLKTGRIYTRYSSTTSNEQLAEPPSSEALGSYM